METQATYNGKSESTEIKSEEKTQANADSNDGQHEVNVLDEAKKVNDEMRKQNEIKLKLIEREEKLLARQETLRALGGGSPAGQQTAKPKEETSKEYATRVLNETKPKL